MTEKLHRFNSKGLWLAGVRAEVQPVKPAHRKECYVCAKHPKHRRLALQHGAGRSATTQILCMVCGALWIEMIVREGKRALSALAGTLGGDPIRLGWHHSHTRSIWLRHKLRPKPKEPKDSDLLPHNGTDTSRKAASSMIGHARTLRRRIVMEISRRSSATCDEIEIALGLSHQTASARIRELTQDGLLRVTSKRRRTISGRLARVYALTTSGLKL